MKEDCAPALLAVIVLATPPALAAGAHVHGKATLNIAIDGGTLTLDFASPLDDLVGFERAPRNENERAEVRRMAGRLHQAGALFVPTAEARCTQTAVKLDSAVIPPALLARPNAHGEPHRAPAKPGSAHAELDAEIVFSCEQPGKLASVEVHAFDAFPRLKRIDARVAAPGKQLAVELTPRTRRVSW